jgi:hypothetical protein
VLLVPFFVFFTIHVFQQQQQQQHVSLINITIQSPPLLWMDFEPNNDDFARAGG